MLTAYIHTIRIYEDHCMYKSAIACALKALEICEKDSYGLSSAIMHNYAQIQDIDDAEEFYQALNESDTDLDADLHLPLSALYFTLSDYQKSYEVLSELVDHNDETVDFLLDWEDGFYSMDEKMHDYFGDLYGEELEPYSYDSFVEIWVSYADFYRDREAYFDWAISLYQPSED